MKNDVLYYKVGALLYCPANKKTIADSIINEKFGKNYSLALCLEDTINDDFVEEAEQELVHSISLIHEALEKKSFYLPKIFIRVRYPSQITKLTLALRDYLTILDGFILPKFSLDTCEAYLNELVSANELAQKKLYTMPIYESATIVDLDRRTDILYSLKDSLSRVEDLVLNIRVGGNDLSHTFGLRRHADETIYQIRPIANIFSDLITIYGRDYIVSGPVWEYYSGPNWEQGMLREIREDQLCGFTGKTVIHPNQIPVVNRAYQVSAADYNDAREILNWNKDSNAFVCGSHLKNRMNEYKTHTNWARRMLYLAEVYGVRDESL